MTDVFNIILTKLIMILEGKLHDLFVYNDVLDQYIYNLQHDPKNPTLLAKKTPPKSSPRRRWRTLMTLTSKPSNS